MARPSNPKTVEEYKLRVRTAQRSQAKRLNDLPPSQVTDAWFLFADRKLGDYPRSTVRSGKWLLFVPNERIDIAWTAIRNATEAGLLGGSSKVATAKQNPNAVDSRTKVICVYTYDSEDESDVRRVREELRKLGYEAPLSYKTDQATLEGRYTVRGGRNISRWRL